MKSDMLLTDYQRALPPRPQRNVAPHEQLQVGATVVNVAIPTLPSEINRGGFSKTYGASGAEPPKK